LWWREAEFQVRDQHARLKQDVQRNCDISDANFGGVFSLCGFLLRLRDLYKWEKDLLPWEEPDPAELLGWVDAREQFWEEIAAAGFGQIAIDGERFDPFEVEAINGRLRPQGLVYGAGYSAGMKPSFLLGELIDSRRFEDLQIDIVDQEMARDLFVSPAMRQGSQILARRSPMLFFLWDQVLEMRPSARDALRYALAQYDLDADAMRREPRKLAAALREVGRRELDVWIFHEIGEAREDVFPGLIWQEIVATYSSSPIELFARVLKDLLADHHREGLLGHIIKHRLRASLGFYFAFMRPFTRLLSAELVDAFPAFRRCDDWAAIESSRQAVFARARGHASTLVEIHLEGRRRGFDWSREQLLSTIIKPFKLFNQSEDLKEQQ
jgi:hypothetical protein